MMALIRIERLGINVWIEIIPSLFVFITTLVVGGSFYSALSVAIFTYSLVWYVHALGKELAIVPAISLIASGQWLLGPSIYYSFDSVYHFKYYMYVNESTYFSYALPSTMAFILALRTFFPLIAIKDLKSYLLGWTAISLRSAYLVLLFGIFCSLAISFAPSSIRFLLFLGSQTTFISVLYLFILNSKWRWHALIAIFFSLLANSTDSGLFHNFLLWSALILSFIFAELRIRFLGKFLIILLGIVLVAQLQAAKAQYRLMIALDPSRAGISTLADMMLNVGSSAQGASINSERNWAELNARLNQGWIVSATMDYVPATRDFEYGSTIALAIRDAVLPRFLVDKRIVRVSDYFKDYTGLEVNSRTSFGISVLGEAWVNFGYLGIVFMFLFGSLYGVVFQGVLKAARRYPTIILWSPLLFLQALKSETEFVVVLNHMIKSGIFILLFYIFVNKFMRFKI